MPEDLSEAIDGVNARIDALMPIAIARGAEHVRGVSTALAPIRQGDLRGSASVVVEGNEGEVYYPGPYARRQHFELTWQHPRGGQALYLEQPMATEAEKVIQIMSDTLGEAFT